MFKFTSLVRHSVFQFAKKKKITASDLEPVHSIQAGLKLIKESCKKNFDETIDFQLKLNVDPKHGDQMVRGTCIMPGGLGKKVTIAVLTSAKLQDTAQKAGADFSDSKEILAMIKDNAIKFEKLIATPDMMSELKAFAKQLGPRGLMPNIKAGTLISGDTLEFGVKAAKAGQIEFRVDDGKNLMAPVGKVSFDDQLILQNIQALSIAIEEKRPKAIKGALISEANIKTTMGKRIRIDVDSFNNKILIDQNQVI